MRPARAVLTFASLALAQFACSAPPSDGASSGPSEDDIIGGGGACVAGAEFRFPGYEEDVSAIASATASHRGGRYSFGKELAAKASDNPVTVVAKGAGDHAGNFQYLAREDWSICDGNVTVEAGAHIMFGEGLSREQLSACSADLSTAGCETLAYYCKAGTVELGAIPRCALEDGIAIEATVYGTGATCTPGSAFSSPGFDDEVTAVAEGEKAHEKAGYVLLSGAPSDSSLLATVGAKGTGSHAGNWQHLARDSWKVCGDELVVEPNAAIEFLGGGLSQAQLEACASDLSGADCATLAHYCEPGTFELSSGRAPRCQLKAGTPVSATLSRRQ